MRDCTLAPALCAATAVGPGCQSFHVGTCIVQCNPTLFGPQCPFPTEVTCAPICHRTFAPACAASPAPACGPNITFGGCSVACFPGQFPGQQGQVAAAVRAAPQSIGVCGQSVGADCTAADLCTVNQCPSQFATCMPVQTCIPNVCTVDSICCQTAFAICPPTPVNPCVSAGATCAHARVRLPRVALRACMSIHSQPQSMSDSSGCVGSGLPTAPVSGARCKARGATASRGREDLPDKTCSGRVSNGA
jgi:hypothetical protein